MVRRCESKLEYNREWRKNNLEKSRASSTKWVVNNPEASMVRTVRHRSSQRGYEFNLEPSDIVIPTHCPVLKMELESGVGKGAGGKENAPSLDRIDNTKGYIKGNVQVISRLANSMKASASPEQLKLFAEWILKEYK